ncbi:uncharacterized protein LOC120780229 [Bactrocera tryoni]|uniref:uncharacterized protein LOC120780229 n=1 Tax=Bactrocera tryoni TaxID=59916 RepID=UPI001A973EBA|nr:uncharacterized protein LOC120780229 [Bactrocera tryoni]
MEFTHGKLVKSPVPYSDSDNDDEECCVGKRGLKRQPVRKEKKKNDNRVLPNPCINTKCKKDCRSVPDISRQNINEHYWGMSNTRRLTWLHANIKQKQIKKKASWAGSKACAKAKLDV